ncbi:MAG: hypothetical protein PHS37_03840 [Candidatus Omnitrophica bacterium]|nr:hypothetical protein [Candidatus Omnitrophota bacterium]
MRQGEVIDALSETGVLQEYGAVKDQIEEIISHIRREGKIPDSVDILFAVPNEGRTKLWWINDPETFRPLYAGGHFNQAGTRIHISLPLIFSQPDAKQAAYDIAMHDFAHIQGKGHGKDKGFYIVSGVADIEVSLQNEDELVPENTIAAWLGERGVSLPEPGTIGRALMRCVRIQEGEAQKIADTSMQNNIAGLFMPIEGGRTIAIQQALERCGVNLAEVIDIVYGKSAVQVGPLGQGTFRYVNHVIIETSRRKINITASVNYNIEDRSGHLRMKEEYMKLEQLSDSKTGDPKRFQKPYALCQFSYDGRMYRVSLKEYIPGMDLGKILSARLSGTISDQDIRTLESVMSDWGYSLAEVYRVTGGFITDPHPENFVADDTGLFPTVSIIDAEDFKEALTENQIFDIACQQLTCLEQRIDKHPANRRILMFNPDIREILWRAYLFGFIRGYMETRDLDLELFLNAMGARASQCEKIIKDILAGEKDIAANPRLRNGYRFIVKPSSAEKHVSCGTICEAGHQEFLDPQLERFYYDLARAMNKKDPGILGKNRYKNLKAKPLTDGEVILALQLTGTITPGQARQLVRMIKHLGAVIPEMKLNDSDPKKIRIFFAIPPGGKKLWWIHDPETGEPLYAGGHFNGNGTRIHISLPLIFSANNPVKAAHYVAMHEYEHIRPTGKDHEDNGMRFVRSVEARERPAAIEPDTGWLPVIRTSALIAFSGAFFVLLITTLRVIVWGEPTVLNWLSIAVSAPALMFTAGTAASGLWDRFVQTKKEVKTPAGTRAINRRQLLHEAGVLTAGMMAAYSLNEIDRMNKIFNSLIEREDELKYLAMLYGRIGLDKVTFVTPEKLLAICRERGITDARLVAGFAEWDGRHVFVSVPGLTRPSMNFDDFTTEFLLNQRLDKKTRQRAIGIAFHEGYHAIMAQYRNKYPPRIPFIKTSDWFITGQPFLGDVFGWKNIDTISAKEPIEGSNAPLACFWKLCEALKQYPNYANTPIPYEEAIAYIIGALAAGGDIFEMPEGIQKGLEADLLNDYKREVRLYRLAGLFLQSFEKGDKDRFERMIRYFNERGIEVKIPESLWDKLYWEPEKKGARNADIQSKPAEVEQKPVPQPGAQPLLEPGKRPSRKTKGPVMYAARIGKAVHVTDILRDTASGTNVVAARVEDYDSGEQYDLPLAAVQGIDFKQRIDSLKGIGILNDTAKEIMDTMAQFLDFMRPDVYTFDEVIADLFGFTRDARRDRLIAIHKDFINDPVAFFHECAEFAIASGEMGITIKKETGEMRITVFGQHWTLDVREAMDSLRTDGEGWIDWSQRMLNIRRNQHYLLRIIQRQLFKEHDRQLTGAIGQTKIPQSSPSPRTTPEDVEMLTSRALDELASFAGKYGAEHTESLKLYGCPITWQDIRWISYPLFLDLATNIFASDDLVTDLSGYNIMGFAGLFFDDLPAERAVLRQSDRQDQTEAFRNLIGRIEDIGRWAFRSATVEDRDRLVNAFSDAYAAYYAAFPDEDVMRGSTAERPIDYGDGDTLDIGTGITGIYHSTHWTGAHKLVLLDDSPFAARSVKKYCEMTGRSNVEVVEGAIAQYDPGISFQHVRASSMLHHLSPVGEGTVEQRRQKARELVFSKVSSVLSSDGTFHIYDRTDEFRDLLETPFDGDPITYMLETRGVTVDGFVLNRYTRETYANQFKVLALIAAEIEAAGFSLTIDHVESATDSRTHKPFLLFEISARKILPQPQVPYTERDIKTTGDKLVDSAYKGSYMAEPCIVGVVVKVNRGANADEINRIVVKNGDGRSIIEKHGTSFARKIQACRTGAKIGDGHVRCVVYADDGSNDKANLERIRIFTDRIAELQRTAAITRDRTFVWTVSAPDRADTELPEFRNLRRLANSTGLRGDYIPVSWQIFAGPIFANYIWSQKTFEGVDDQRIAVLENLVSECVKQMTKGQTAFNAEQLLNGTLVLCLPKIEPVSGDFDKLRKIDLETAASA